MREEEVHSLVDPWKKDLRTPWKLTVHDVSTLVDLSERISLFRMNMKREKARLRKEGSRKKNVQGSERRKSKGGHKNRKMKKTDRKRLAKYYKLKKKSKRKKPRGTKRVKVKRKKTYDYKSTEIGK